MEPLGAVGIPAYGLASRHQQSLNARDPYGARQTQPGGYRPSSTVPAPLNSSSEFVGFDAHTRHNITQIFFGCQNVMIYAAEGHVELLLSMDPSGTWQPITPDAAEELGQRLLDAAYRARDAGSKVRLKEEAQKVMEAQMNDSERSRP